VENTGGRVDEVALTQLVASGWEIGNASVDGTAALKQSAYDFRDIRDDRVMTYFDLNAGQTKTFRIPLHASYVGHYYLPLIRAEAMYDASVSGQVKGQWVDVVVPGMSVAGR